MIELPFVILFSIILSVVLSVFQLLLAHPKRKELRWLLGYDGRKEIESYPVLLISVVSFFTIGADFVLIYRSYLLGNLYLWFFISTCLLLVLCLLLGQYVIGKNKTLSIISGLNEPLTIPIILTLWIFLFCINFSVIVTFESNSPKILKLIAFQLLVTIITAFIFVALSAWRIFTVTKLKQISDKIDCFIQDEFNYYMAIKLIRKYKLDHFTKMSISNINFFENNAKRYLFSNVIEKMNDSSLCKSIFHLKPIENLVSFGIYTKKPIPATLCADRIFRAIKHYTFFRNEQREIVALLQIAKTKYKDVEIGASLQKLGKNRVLSGKVADFKYMTEEPYVYFQVNNHEEEEEENNPRVIEICKSHLLWIQL